MSPPITYMVDGKQYVSVAGGRGTVAPVPGFPPAPPTTPPRLLTFVLDGKAQVPKAEVK
jgi:hypothetical protein